jgi:hypothetical protein
LRRDDPDVLLLWLLLPGLLQRSRVLHWLLVRAQCQLIRRGRPRAPPPHPVVARARLPAAPDAHYSGRAAPVAKMGTVRQVGGLAQTAVPLPFSLARRVRRTTPARTSGTRPLPSRGRAPARRGLRPAVPSTFGSRLGPAPARLSLAVRVRPVPPPPAAHSTQTAGSTRHRLPPFVPIPSRGAHPRGPCASLRRTGTAAHAPSGAPG